jgi:hypothetical protein
VPARTQLKARIAALYEKWDPLELSAKELHDLDDEIYKLEEQLDRLHDDEDSPD